MLLLLGDHGAADRHDGGDEAVDPLVDSSLVVRLPAGPWAEATLGPIRSIGLQRRWGAD
jgi:hypothetical protein